MRKIPSKIEDSFEKIERQYPFRVVLKRINGKYYVYKERGIWLKEKAKTKTISEYLGRITEDGLYIKKAFSAKDDLENAKALIVEKGGEIIWHGKHEGALPEAPHVTATEVDLKLLMALSMNARMPGPRLARIAGISEQTVYSRVKSLEKRYGIRYLAETDMFKLGFLEYIVFVKFTNKYPEIEEMKRAASEEAKVQFAAVTKGDYDMIMYIFDESSGAAMDTMWRMRSQSPLKSYDATWWLSPISMNYGFMPFRDEFFERILKGRIWTRSEDSLRPLPGQLLQREFNVMRELNRNGVKEFSEIDRSNGMPQNTSRYTYYKLKEKTGIINRITMTMEKLPMRYLGVMLLKYENGEAYRNTRAELLKEVIIYGQLANKYAYEGDIGVPESIMLFMPVMEEKELDATVEDLNKKVSGIRTTTLLVTNVLVGNLCYRRFDNAYSRQYEILVEKFNTRQEKKENYD